MNGIKLWNYLTLPVRTEGCERFRDVTLVHGLKGNIGFGGDDNPQTIKKMKAVEEFLRNWSSNIRNDRYRLENDEAKKLKEAGETDGPTDTNP